MFMISDEIEWIHVG